MCHPVVRDQFLRLRKIANCLCRTRNGPENPSPLSPDCRATEVCFGGSVGVGDRSEVTGFDA
jgi:hypothetical protein